MSDLEFIDESEFLKAQAPAKPKGTKRSSKLDLSVRTNTVWYQLTHKIGFCTVPMHDSIQEMLSDEQKAYRQIHPTRMVVAIEPYDVCKDCFLHDVDSECAREGLAPLELTDSNS